MRALKIGTNKSGKRFALVARNGAFAVYAECSNYCRTAPGGIAKTWRYCEKGLDREAADRLFAQKVAGRAKQ